MQLTKTLLPLILAAVAVSAHPVGPSDVAPASESSKLPVQAVPTPPMAPKAPSPPVSSSSTSSSAPANTRRAEMEKPKPMLPVSAPVMVPRDEVEPSESMAPKPETSSTSASIPQPTVLPRDDADDEDDMDDDDKSTSSTSTEYKPTLSFEKRASEPTTSSSSSAPSAPSQVPVKLPRHFPHAPELTDNVFPKPHHEDASEEADKAPEEAPFPANMIVAAKEKTFQY